MSDFMITARPGITKFGEVLITETGVLIRDFRWNEWPQHTLREAALNWALDEIRAALKRVREEAVL